MQPLQDAAAAETIADEIAKLVEIATANELHMTAYMLQMALQEARAQAKARHEGTSPTVIPFGKKS